MYDASSQTRLLSCKPDREGAQVLDPENAARKLVRDIADQVRRARAAGASKSQAVRQVAQDHELTGNAVRRALDMVARQTKGA